jgi:hypothetical protein
VDGESVGDREGEGEAEERGPWEREPPPLLLKYMCKSLSTSLLRSVLRPLTCSCRPLVVLWLLPPETACGGVGGRTSNAASTADDGRG